MNASPEGEGAQQFVLQDEQSNQRNAYERVSLLTSVYGH